MWCDFLNLTFNQAEKGNVISKTQKIKKDSAHVGQCEKKNKRDSERESLLLWE